eukprot:scaffold32514_cov57-Cyclotella_meneghiniana.AAC.9
MHVYLYYPLPGKTLYPRVLSMRLYPVVTARFTGLSCIIGVSGFGCDGAVVQQLHYFAFDTILLTVVAEAMDVSPRCPNLVSIFWVIASLRQEQDMFKSPFKIEKCWR